MILRTFSAISVFIASVAISVALYRAVTHHPNATLVHQLGYIIEGCMNILCFAGAYLILKPRGKV